MGIKQTAGGVLFEGSRLFVVWKEGGARDGWVLPKGGVRPGEAEPDAAVREVQEETSQGVRAGQLLTTFTRTSIHPGYEGDVKRVALYEMIPTGELLPPAAAADQEVYAALHPHELIPSMRYPEERAVVVEYYLGHLGAHYAGMGA